MIIDSIVPIGSIGHAVVCSHAHKDLVREFCVFYGPSTIYEPMPIRFDSWGQFDWNHEDSAGKARFTSQPGQKTIRFPFKTLEPSIHSVHSGKHFLDRPSIRERALSKRGRGWDGFDRLFMEIHAVIAQWMHGWKTKNIFESCGQYSSCKPLQLHGQLSILASSESYDDEDDAL